MGETHGLMASVNGAGGHCLANRLCFSHA
jgi:hypothetical protein